MKPETLKLLIAAGNPIISISTPDETRAVRVVHEVAQRSACRSPLVADRGPAGPRHRSGAGRGGQAGGGAQIRQGLGQSGNLLFKDLGQHAKEPQILRYLRDLYFSPVSRPWTIILVGRHRAADGDAAAEPAV